MQATVQTEQAVDGCAAHEAGPVSDNRQQCALFLRTCGTV